MASGGFAGGVEAAPRCHRAPVIPCLLTLLPVNVARRSRSPVGQRTQTRRFSFVSSFASTESLATERPVRVALRRRSTMVSSSACRSSACHAFGRNRSAHFAALISNRRSRCPLPPHTHNGPPHSIMGIAQPVGRSALGRDCAPRSASPQPGGSRRAGTRRTGPARGGRPNDSNDTMREPIDRLRVSPVRPSHGEFESVGRLRHQHQMHMIRHQAPREQRGSMLGHLLPQRVDVESSVVIGEEGVLAVVPTF